MGIVSLKGVLDRVLAWLAGLAFLTLAVWLLGMPRTHLFLPGSRVDLGDIAIGESCEKEFPIFNHSSTPIEIESWAPTCRCVQARFTQTIIPPGRSISAYVSSQATNPLGKRAAVISLRWHFVGDEAPRTDNLVVSARYVSPVSLSEDHLVFWDVPSNETQTKNFFVRAGNETGVWDDLEIASASSHLVAHIERSSSGFAVSTQIDPRGLPSGVWKSNLRILMVQNGVKTGAETDVPVMAKVEGPYAANPPVLQFFATDRSELGFRLEIHSSTIAIHKLQLLGDLVRSSAIKINDAGTEAIVTGFLAKPVGKGVFVGKIPFQINEGTDGLVQVPFIGYPG